MRILDVSKVRGSLATIVDSIGDGGSVVVIMRYQRPIAAIVPTSRLSSSERKVLESLQRGTMPRSVKKRPAPP